MATNNANFSTIVATTLQNFSNKIMDNVVSNNTLFRFLEAKGNVKIVKGGRQFIHQILYAQNPSFAARGKLDTITLPNTNPITASEWDPKVLSGSIMLPTLDIAMNAGDREKLIDYTEAKKLEAEVTMGELCGDQIFNTAVGANDFDSIPRIISDTPSLDTNVGGIDSTSGNATWWRNFLGSTAVTAFNTSQNGINAIDSCVNGATKGQMRPRLIITTSAIYTLYMLGLTSNARYTSMDSADAAFKSLMYGDMPFVFDDNCPASHLYGIDTDSIKLQVLGQGNMKTTPFQFSTSQLAESALMYFFANLTCGSRRTNFVITSITA